ncbi:MAG: ATP-binding cassette domain-containing protein [Clostridia bacterium]|nr:ATP-binding cassette domain-containing protein [Clostridia bacterium]
MAQKNELKVKKYARRTERLNRCNNRYSCYNNYLTEHSIVLNEKRRQAIAQREAELGRKYAQAELEANDPASMLNRLNQKAVEDKKVELRLKYRAKREKTKRLIAKEQRKDAAYNAQPMLDELARYEQSLNAELERYADERTMSAEAKLTTIDQPSAKVLYEKESRQRAEALDAYKNKINSIYDRKIESFEKKTKKRIERWSDKTRKAQEKLKEVVVDNEHLVDDDVVLSVENLSMHFGGLKAVSELSFKCHKNEIFGLIGPNGAGKTTVFNCITQFYKCTMGNIVFRTKADTLIHLNNFAVHDIVVQGIARTFQNVEVIRECTVMENLMIAATRQFSANLFEQMFHFPILKIEESVIRNKALKVLQFMGLMQYKDMIAFGLPYGVLKKIEIARTLMCDPQLIIMDEPAAGLNDTETAELAKLIRKIRDEYDCAILLVEHDMSLVMDICDNICAISFGRLLAYGTPDDIQSNKLVQEAYLGVAEDEYEKEESA